MKICFLLDEQLRSQSANIKAALFELALRIGLPFYFHKSGYGLPEEDFVISYGCKVPENYRGLALPYLEFGTYDSLQFEDAILWTFSQGEVHDVVKGSINLLRFEHENLNNPKRDDKGRILPTEHILYQKNLLQTPLLENNALYILNLIEKTIGKRIDRIYPWSKGSYVVAMTHDVDGPELHSLFARSRSAFLGLIKKDKFEKDSYIQSRWTRKYGAKDPYWNFDVWMKLEKQWGLKSAFYFYTGGSPKSKRHKNDPHYDFNNRQYINVLNQINRAGCEVGLHYGINENNDAAYALAIQQITSKVNQKKVGGRAHYWSIDQDYSPLSSFGQMEDGGLYYDASINPQGLGFRNGSMLPISPSLFNKGISAPLFSVLPTSIMDGYCMKRYSFSRTPGEDAVKLFRQIKKASGMVVLDWHVRTAHNLGAWQGFLNPLHELMTEFNSDESGKAMLPSEIIEAWIKYTEQLFKGDFT